MRGRDTSASPFHISWRAQQICVPSVRASVSFISKRCKIGRKRLAGRFPTALRFLSIVSVRKLHSLLRQKHQPAVRLMLKVLFVCSGNSCRSQMAEGWSHKLKAGVIEASSAGIETHGLHPDAVRVMAEVGVDISRHQSKLVGDLRELDFDVIVTLSERVRRMCPVFRVFWSRAQTIHFGLESPLRFTASASTEKERLTPFREVRDAIHTLVESLPDSLRRHSHAEGRKRLRQGLGV